MRNYRKYLVAILLLAAGVTSAVAIPSKPNPPRLVNDYAGVFQASQRMALERKLTAFDDSTSNQITVVTVNDLEGYSPAEYGTEIGLRWEVGSKNFDNGIVVLVKPKTAGSDGQVNISVGYGLEGAIPDSYAKRIINNEMIPAFSRGDYFAGVDNACTVLMQLASGEIDAPRETTGSGSSMWIILFFILFLIIVFRGKNNRKGGGNNGSNRKITSNPDFLKGLIIGSLLSNSGNSSPNHYGGSFGGGGGFGGFGGGSFGGGGASGNW